MRRGQKAQSNNRDWSLVDSDKVGGPSAPSSTGAESYSENPLRERLLQDEEVALDEWDDLEPDPVLDSSWPGCLRISKLASVASCVCFPLSAMMCCGLTTISEKRSVAYLYFGRYVGTISSPGIHWVPPIGAEWRILSTATQTMNMKDLKVLDSKGNPVIISAVVTFAPTSAKKACIDVQNPWPQGKGKDEDTFLNLQAQAVLKQVTSQFPYEAPNGEPSLQTEGEQISRFLIKNLQKKVAVAGAKILALDLVDLSYAPEIASAMLVRQQAAALVDARKLIVQAAVDMTSDAVSNLELKTGKAMSDEMRERTCSNLLTVVCSSEAVTPTLPVNS